MFPYSSSAILLIEYHMIFLISSQFRQTDRICFSGGRLLYIKVHKLRDSIFDVFLSDMLRTHVTGRLSGIGCNCS